MMIMNKKNKLDKLVKYEGDDYIFVEANVRSKVRSNDIPEPKERLLDVVEMDIFMQYFKP